MSISIRRVNKAASIQYRRCNKKHLRWLRSSTTQIDVQIMLLSSGSLKETLWSGYSCRSHRGRLREREKKSTWLKQPGHKGIEITKGGKWQIHHDSIRASTHICTSSKGSKSCQEGKRRTDGHPYSQPSSSPRNCWIRIR